jgi:hypothetical protein
MNTVPTFPRGHRKPPSHSVGQRQRVDIARPDKDDVGLLARCQRADLVRECRVLRAAHSRELQLLSHRQARWHGFAPLARAVRPALKNKGRVAREECIELLKPGLPPIVGESLLRIQVIGDCRELLAF